MTTLTPRMPFLTTEPATKETLFRPSTKRKLAYLTTEYPKVSHTFIRREIAELEQLGIEVTRLAIRPPSAPLVDPADQVENNKTLHCLKQKPVKLIGGALLQLMKRPLSGLSSAMTAYRLFRKSDRGLIRHAAYLTEAAYLARKLQQEGINHVHVHFGTNAAAVALLMKKLAGITYSMTVHGPGEFDAPIGLSLAEKVAESQFTVAISHFGKAQLQRWVKPEYWDRIHVIRCTVNQEFLSPPTNQIHTAHRLLCIGRLTPQKGQLLLIDAFAEYVRGLGAGHLVLAGDGELRPAIEERIRKHNLSRRVTITGWLSEKQVREEIRNCRAVILPSSAEGLPVVLMEALAMGRPVISTFTAGIPELVRPGENGWLVPVGDRNALVESMHDLELTSYNRLEAMGKAGHELVKLQHHPRIEAQKLFNLFAKYSCSVSVR